MPTTIEAATKDWAYDQMAAAFRTPGVWVEVSGAFYNQAFEVMPPIYRARGFLVSEPYTHTAEDRAVYAGFVMINRRHFARYSTVREFPAAVQALEAALVTTAQREG